MPDPFTLLGLEPSFDVSLSELANRHRDLSTALHPDRHANASASVRRQALGRAIDVNEAYRKLKNPVTRAEALLERLGLSANPETQKADPSFLMEMMTQREALGEARSEKDGDAVETLEREIAVQQKQTLERLSGAFTSLPITCQLGAATGSLGRVQEALGELRYYRRFLEEVSMILDDLEP